jgi:alanine racemase
MSTEPDRTQRPRTYARIDLDAIAANVGLLSAAAPSAEVMAVVKADAYGHGLLPSSRAALRGGATWLGTAFPEEALALRAAGIDARVLCWLFAPDDELDELVAADVDLSSSASWSLDAISAAAYRTGRQARVHLKIDTGLGRSGATPAGWEGFVEQAARIEADGAVRVVGVWSHLAWADQPQHPTIVAQTEVFNWAIALADKHLPNIEVRHLANSAATLAVPRAHFDLVRPGIAVYGVSPGPEVGGTRELGLRPAMTLGGRVVNVKRVPGGHGVAYGHEYTTASETTLVLVPLGYADGIPRAVGNAGPALIAGHRMTIAGRVSMDQVVFDVGDLDVSVGDDVVFFGTGDDGEPTADNWADAADTIAYEIVTRVGPRVPRVYVGTGA